MHLDIGSDVVTSEGQQVGTVERIIFDPDSMRVREFVIHQGPFFRTDRIIQRGLVDHIDDRHTVHLRITADEVKRLPPFLAEQHVPVFGSQYAGAKPALVQVQPGSVPRDAVVLTHRAEVYDCTGKHVGHLDEIVYEPDGAATAFIVDAGRVRVHDVHIPLTAIRSIRRDRIELSITAEEAGEVSRGVRHSE